MNVAKKSFFGGGFSAKNNYICLALIIVFFLSIFLRYYGFHQPHGLTFDEGLYSELLAPQLKENPTHYSTQAAYEFHTAQGQHLPKYLDRPLFKHPPLYCYLIALGYTFFGINNLVAVSVSILLGSLMVLLVYFLGKAFYDYRVGLLAAFFLCIEPVHWICSERIWMETTLSFFMLLAVFLFALGQKQKYYLPFSGISIGLAMLTKYPGILVLFIIFSFVVLMDRRLLKQKSFWILCFLSFLVFSPWVIWNWKVYGNFNDAVISAHNLLKYWENAARILFRYKEFLPGFFLLTGIFFVMRHKIKLFLKTGPADQIRRKPKKIFMAACFLTFILAFILIPFARGIMKEAFIWKDNILVGWSNPFKDGPWHFYLTRLSELSPLYIFSFFSVFLFFGKNKVDKLLIWSSLWILGAFILWGNYQSRYILPAVPFLVILSARWQVWAYDKLSLKQAAAGEPSNFASCRILLKILFFGVSLYFILKTLRVDWLIALHPDFGYF